MPNNGVYGEVSVDVAVQRRIAEQMTSTAKEFRQKSENFVANMETVSDPSVIGRASNPNNAVNVSGGTYGPSYYNSGDMDIAGTLVRALEHYTEKWAEELALVVGEMLSPRVL